MFSFLDNVIEGKLLVEDDGSELFYDDLYEFGQKFREIIPSRSLILCLCKNNQESLLAYLTSIECKIVPILLESGTNIDQIKNIISSYKPEFIWIPNANKDSFKDFEFEFEYKNYILLSKKNLNVHKLDKNLALLLSTSGSTGSPKFVRLSYKNLESNASSISEYLSISKKEKPITVLPMSYSFGLSIINSHIINGCTILMTTKSIMQKDFWEFFKINEATSISGVPYTFEILLKLGFLKMHLPHLKTITQAGGSLKKELVKEFSDYSTKNNKNFFVMYGQTEATARMSYLPPEQASEKLESIGIPIPKGSFEIMDDNNKIISEDNVEGELVYKGPNVSMGYANNLEDLSKPDINKGILYTGDIAKKDSDDFYYIVGRKNRFIKVYGNRINLDDTEKLLKSVVDDVACKGIDDNLEIYFVGQEKVDVLKQFIKDKTSINSHAISYIEVNEIPKTSAGKIKYTELVRS